MTLLSRPTATYDASRLRQTIISFMRRIRSIGAVSQANKAAFPCRTPSRDGDATGRRRRPANRYGQAVYQYSSDRHATEAIRVSDFLHQTASAAASVAAAAAVWTECQSHRVRLHCLYVCLSNISISAVDMLQTRTTRSTH